MVTTCDSVLSKILLCTATLLLYFVFLFYLVFLGLMAPPHFASTAALALGSTIGRRVSVMVDI